MTTLDVLRTVVRRWPVVLIGLLVTLGTLVWVDSRPGVYSTLTDVYLVAPGGQNVSQQVGSDSESLISLAGLVEVRVNHDSKVVQPTSPDVTITSMGIYNGSSVVLPNTGTQFVLQFDSPKLRVRASGPTVQATTSNLARAVRSVRAALAAVQDEEGVARSARVTTKAVPDNPAVQYANGRPSRALAAVAALGAGLSVASAVLLDRLLAVRRRRRAGPPATPGSSPRPSPEPSGAGRV